MVAGSLPVNCVDYILSYHTLTAWSGSVVGCSDSTDIVVGLVLCRGSGIKKQSGQLVWSLRNPNLVGIYARPHEICGLTYVRLVDTASPTQYAQGD